MNKYNYDPISKAVIKWCIYAVVFAAPFSKSISEIAIALSIALWASRKVLRGEFRIERTELNLPFLLIVLTIIPSFANTALPLLSLKALFSKVLKYIAFYYVIVETMDRPSLKDLLILAFISASVILVDGFIQYHFTYQDLIRNYPSFKFRAPVDGFFKGFPTASFPYQNDLAAWILLAFFPLACVTIFDLEGKKVRYLTAALAAGLFYLFFLTKARGAWLGFAFSILYIAIAKHKFWLIGLLVLLVAVPFLCRMEMAQYLFGLGSVGDRVFMWRTGWEIFKEHPVIGNGLNTFFVKFQEHRNDQDRGLRGSYAHNCYLQMAADVGLLGLAGFLWFTVSYFRSVMRNLKRVRDPFFGPLLWGLSIGVCAFLIHSFFDTNLYSLNLATLFWCAVALSESIIKVCKA